MKQYIVTVSIAETEQKIIDTSCDGCAASAGGCKPTLVIMFWLEKRSSEPSPTSTHCYWKKPSLSGEKSVSIQGASERLHCESEVVGRV